MSHHGSDWKQWMRLIIGYIALWLLFASIGLFAAGCSIGRFRMKPIKRHYDAVCDQSNSLEYCIEKGCDLDGRCKEE